MSIQPNLWLFVEPEWGEMVKYEEGNYRDNEHGEVMYSQTGDWNPKWTEYAKKHGLRIVHYVLSEDMTDEILSEWDSNPRTTH